MRAARAGGRGLALAGAITLACAHTALGAPGRELNDVRKVRDGNDVRGPLDLKSVAFGQLGRGVVWRVTTRSKWGAGDLAQTPQRSLCLLLHHGKRKAPDASLCVTKHRHSHPFALRYSKLTAAGARKHSRLVHAHIVRRDRFSFSATLAPADLRLRAGMHYGWSVRSTWSEYGVCNGPGACADSAPDNRSVGARFAAVRPVGCTARGSHYVTNGSRRHRVVALTFDDGPSPYTPQVLRILEERKVPATFFLIGQQIASRAAYSRRALSDGDIVGDHTWSHPNVSGDGSFARHQILSTKSAIRHYLGFEPCLFRAPYGAVSGALISEAWSLGFNTIQWDVDPRDWSRPGSEAIYSRVTGAVRPGSIVIMHDGGGPRDQTVSALPRIISNLRSRGYSFTTVAGLLGERVVYGRG